jgi:hypothetical protein
MFSRPRPATKTADGARPDTGMAVAYVLLELVLVPLGVLLLALSSVPGRAPRAPVTPPANAKALSLPPVSEPGAVLLVDPGRRTGAAR